jgi:hypothetical protein
MSYKIIEVKTASDVKAFFDLHTSLYCNDPNWIRPLNKDVAAVFDPKQNKFFRHGSCVRFIVVDNNDHPVGRIAAFINEKLAHKEEQPTGGIGFFDSINNQEVANLLFDTARTWLSSQKMEAMDGPINFGERDSWWGCLVEGFTPVPYKMNYNFPYYNELFTNYGFQNYFEQWCYSLKVENKLQEKFYDRHKAIKSDPAYRAAYLKKNDLEKYAEDFRIIYNKAWAKHGGGKELEQKQVLAFFKKMKAVIDEQIMWYVYHHNEPIAMWINLPDINQLFAPLKGKFGWFEKLKFIISLKRRKTNKFIGLVFGIVPEFQGKGIDSFIIVEGANHIQKHQLYEDFEMQWIGDFNPKMISIAENLGTYKSRRLITYRCLFDTSKPFSRHKKL